MSVLSAALERRVASRTRSIVVIYIAAFAAAEILSAFVRDVAAGPIAHAAIALAALHQRELLAARGSSEAREHRTPLLAFLLCIAVASVARIAPMVLPLEGLTPAVWPAVAALPIVIGIGEAKRLGRSEAWSSAWFSANDWEEEVLVALSGVPLSLLTFTAMRPKPMLPGADAVALGTAVVSLLALAAVEETLYRGLLQRSLSGVVGGWAVPLTAGLTAVAAVGNRSIAGVIVVGLIALAFGAWVRRTERLVGVAVAHGVLLIGTFLVWPRFA